MRIEYQYLPKDHEKPNTMTLSDVPHVVPTGEPIPQKGDFVILQYSHPEEIRGNYGHFEIVARHFFYLPNGDQQDHSVFIVRDAPLIPETNFRE